MLLVKEVSHPYLLEIFWIIEHFLWNLHHSLSLWTHLSKRMGCSKAAYLAQRYLMLWLMIFCFQLPSREILNIRFMLVIVRYGTPSPCAQFSAERVHHWALQWGFRFSSNKSIAVVFTRKTNIPNLLLTLNNSIPFWSTVKFLGLNFDKRLNGKSPVKD